LAWAIALAGLLLAGCEPDEAVPGTNALDSSSFDMGDVRDQESGFDILHDSTTALETDISLCQPPCDLPNAACIDGECRCAPGYHNGDGARGECVPEGSCMEGYGIPEGQTECIPVKEFCDETDPCELVTGWSEGACLYENEVNGTLCETDTVDVCADHFECVDGLCEPVWPACADDLRPVLLVHGVNGSSENFETMTDRLIEDGWPESYVFAFDAEDPSWGCNVDNAADIRELVDDMLETTCHSRIDIVAHSMGTMSSRHFINNLGGLDLVNTTVTLGGMNHGLSSPCFAPEFLNICVWIELCESGDFIEELNAGDETPGDIHWVSIFGTEDSDVPNSSSRLDGAENIEIEGAEHDGPNGLLEREDVYNEVLRVLQYPCW